MSPVSCKSEDLSQVNPQLLKWMGIINDKSSIDSIPNPAQNVNQRHREWFYVFLAEKIAQYCRQMEKNKQPPDFPGVVAV